MEVHLLGQQTDPAGALSQRGVVGVGGKRGSVLIIPMIMMTNTDMKHMEAQMLHYKTRSTHKVGTLYKPNRISQSVSKT